MTNQVLSDIQPGLVELVVRSQERFLDCSGLTIEEAEQLGEVLSTLARDVSFWLGDLSKYTVARWPDTHHQCWPVTQSPGQLARNAAVCAAYPKPEDRQHDCTYSQYMQQAGKPDRQQRLADIVEKGLTTDESRQEGKTPKVTSSPQGASWVLVVDSNYYLHRFWHSGAGVEAATGVADWVRRTAERMKESLGLTHVVCCFDGPNNHRKELTKDWEDRYKDRPKKDVELVNQLHLLRSLLETGGYACVSQEGMEADDLMASYAKQFDGKVTLLSQDKDVRQCLSDKCNILLDVTWSEDPTSGDMLPEYKWISAKQHTEDTGIRPDQWCDYQSIMGDNVDGVRGAEGIGKKGAADLIKEYDTLEGVIAAAKAPETTMTDKRRESLLAFEAKMDVTRQLVTLRKDIFVSAVTKL